jgi:flagellar hook-associated protein 3 FlgL
MRITNLMMTEGAIRNLTDSQDTLNRLQQRISSGKVFTNSSDNPVAASGSLSLRSALQGIDTYVANNGVANDWLNANDLAYSQMEDLAIRAQTLVQNGLNDTLSANERGNALAPEMTSILEQAIELGNTKQNNQYIFSGFQVNTQPFSVSGSTITYTGDTSGGIMNRTIAPNQQVAINTRGDQAFMGFMQAIVDARDALASNNTASLRTALSGLQSGLTTLDQYRTSNGARMRQVSTANDYLQKTQTEASSLLSQKEDANIAEAVTLLKGQETTYQAVLEVSNRAISATSLFNMLS